MARVVRGLRPRTKIDEFLNYLERQWAGIPAVAEEWSEWDEHSRLVFTLDWPVCEDRLQQLEQWADEGVLSAAQQARYEKLIKLVVRHRPIVDQLLDDNAA